MVNKNDSHFNDLKRLSKLNRDGILTDEEYAVEKKQALDLLNAPVISSAGPHSANDQLGSTSNDELHSASNEAPTNGAEKQPRQWYSHGWGLLIAILFFPYFAIYYIWAKKPNWSKKRKSVLTGVMALFMIFAIGSSAEPAPSTNTNARIASESSTKAISPAIAPVASEAKKLYQVLDVVDGDTFKASVNGTNQTVRLIGVDTPETKDPRKLVQCFGSEASAQSTALMKSKNVRLEADKTQSDKDKYGRLLRYAYLEDGTLINKKLIELGYAHEYTYEVPYKFQADFKQAETKARSSAVGLWSPSTCNGTTASTAPATVKPMATPSVPKPQVSTPSPSPAPTPTPTAPSAYYANCTEARNAGVAPIMRGQPGYRSALDRDNDGIACDT